MPKIKAEDMCNNFCDFVDHLKKHHRSQLEAIFADAKVQYIDLAMGDLVQFILKTDTEELHKISEYFLDRLDYWQTYKTHDEL